MKWKQRRHRKYLYRSRRTNGRVVKEYLGAGPEAETALQHDAAERERRAQYRVIDLLFQIHDICIETLLNFTMTAAGYHRHDRGPWRKKRGITMSKDQLADAMSVPEPTPPEQETMRDVIARASNGDSETVPVLREFISTRPGAAMALGGDMWWEAMILQIRNYAGRNIAVREGAFGRINELRMEHYFSKLIPTPDPATMRISSQNRVRRTM